MRPGRAAILVVLAWSLAAAGSQAQELQWTQWSVAQGGNGHEYAVITNLTRWTLQQSAAQAQGGHLVTISSAAENAFVLSVLAASEAQYPYSAWYYYIGLAQDAGSAEPAGGWRWVTGELLADTGYANWATGEPNNGGSPTGWENVGTIYKANGRWNDGNQNSYLRAVIERAGAAVDETPPSLSLDPANPSVLPLTAPGALVSVAVSGQVTDDDSGVASASLTVTDEYGECDTTQDVAGLLGADGSFATTVDLCGYVAPADANGRSYVMTLAATDVAGNAADPVWVSVLAPPDTAAPELSLDPADPSLLPSVEWGVPKPVTISGSVTDGASGVASAKLCVTDEYGECDAEHDVTGLLGADGGFELTISLSCAVSPGDADGRSYEIALSALDNAGNAGGPISVSVLAPPDTTAPQADLSSPDPPVLSSALPDVLKAVTITGCVTDAQSGVDWAKVTVFDEYGELNSQHEVSGLRDGNGVFTLQLALSSRIAGGDLDGRVYEVVLTACDCSGNEAAPASVIVLAERPGPGNNPGDDHRPPHAGPPYSPGNGPRN